LDFTRRRGRVIVEDAFVVDITGRRGKVIVEDAFVAASPVGSLFETPSETDGSPKGTPGDREAGHGAGWAKFRRHRMCEEERTGGGGRRERATLEGERAHGQIFEPRGGRRKTP